MPENCCNYPKILTILFYHTVMCPKDADRMANSVDPDQTAEGTELWFNWSSQSFCWFKLSPCCVTHKNSVGLEDQLQQKSASLAQKYWGRTNRLVVNITSGVYF